MSKSYYNNLNKQPGNNFTTGRNNDIIDIYNTLKEISGRNKQNNSDAKTAVTNIVGTWGGMRGEGNGIKRQPGLNRPEHNKPGYKPFPHKPEPKPLLRKPESLPHKPESLPHKPEFLPHKPIPFHIPKEKKEQDRLKRATGGYNLEKVDSEKLDKHLLLKEKTPDDYYSLSVPHKELNKRLDNEAFGPKTDFSVWNFENNFDKLNKEEQSMLIHKMQLALNNEGYKDYNGYSLKTDGIFGDKTKAAYKQYKKDNKDELEDYKSEFKPMSMNFTDFNTPTHIKTRNILIDNANKKINSSANNNQNSNTNKNGNNDELLIIRNTQNNSAKESIMYQPRPQQIFNKGFSIESQNNNKDDSTHSNNKMSNTIQENINNSDGSSEKNSISANEFRNLDSNKERENAVWNYLTNKLGLSPLHSAAIMGNIAVETGYTFSPSTVQGGKNNYEYNSNDSIGYGLLQWTYNTRKDGLKNYALENGGKIDDYDIQLNYMIEECTNQNYKNAYSSFLNTKTLSDATQFFCENIEQAGVPHMDRRISEAQRIYNEYME